MNGARVAVIGGGICGSAFAAALAQGARARNRRVEIRVYAGPGEPGFAAALLTRECRARLAALGCPTPAEVRPVRGVEVSLGAPRERFPVGPGGIGVVPRESLVRGLSLAAARDGARFSLRRADSIERDGRPEGPLVVRSQGQAERFHAVVIATGAGQAPELMPGARTVPTLAAVEAHLAVRTFVAADVARLFLSPVPGVDGLFLVPNERSMVALAFGRNVSDVDLCLALMTAARDGHLPMGFSVAGVRKGRVPNGAAPSLIAPGVLAVGPAALGHPLQLGLSPALASCSRAAAALLDTEGDLSLLGRTLAEGVVELAEHARAGAGALKWLLRARQRAPAAIARARALDEAGCWGGVLGLPSPTPHSLRKVARRAGVAEVARSIFFVPNEPPGPLPIPPEPRLVYVVDDDDDVREAMTHYLRTRGCEVLGFSDELSLFAAVAVRRPAAVLLDVVLQRVDGIRLCEGLKRHPLTRDVRVLLTSGLDRPHLRSRALAAGAQAFLPKPLDAGLLWAAIAAPEPSSDSRTHTGGRLVESAGHAS